MGFSKYSQKVADEYTHKHPQIPLIDVQILTPRNFFQSLVAMISARTLITISQKPEIFGISKSITSYFF